MKLAERLGPELAVGFNVTLEYCRGLERVTDRIRVLGHIWVARRVDWREKATLECGSDLAPDATQHYFGERNPRSRVMR